MQRTSRQTVVRTQEENNNKNPSSTTARVIRPPARHSQRPTLRNLNPVFHKREKSEDNKELSDKLLKLARKTGTLNLSGRGLATGKSLASACMHTYTHYFSLKRTIVINGQGNIRIF